MARIRVAAIIDVKGWAWDWKTQYCFSYLKGDFDFTKMYQFQEGRLPEDFKDEYDLYLTFAPRYIDMLEGAKIPMEKRITGVTAHFLTIEEDLKRFRGRVRYVHANSVLLVKQAQKYYPKVFYVPNGVEPAVFHRKNSTRSEIFTVGHVGKPAPRKGFEKTILPAFQDAARGRKMQLKVNQRRYKDALTHEEMSDWYQDIDVLVFASDIDGTPNGMLEGAACGVPSIINRIGNAPEFIVPGYNGILMDKVGVSIYAEAIAHLYDNRELCISMGINAWQTVMQDWTWEKQATHYRTMFNTVLGR